MAGALHQVLQEQIVGALLGLADLDLRAIHGEPRFLADIVVEGRHRRRRAVLDLGHEISFRMPGNRLGGRNLAPLAKPRQRPRRARGLRKRNVALALMPQLSKWRGGDSIATEIYRWIGAPEHVHRFFGGPPLAVLGRLILLSILVGVILAAIGLDPWNISNSVAPADRAYLDDGLRCRALALALFPARRRDRGADLAPGAARQSAARRLERRQRVRRVTARGMTEISRSIGRGREPAAHRPRRPWNGRAGRDGAGAGDAAGNGPANRS